MNLTVLAPIAGIISLIFAAYLARWVLKQDPGTQKMVEISNAIREGAMAYLNRQYKTIAVFAVILAAVLAAFLDNGVRIAVGFIAGSISSAVAGYVGMNVSIRANVRTANIAKQGLAKALELSFKGGAVTGLMVVGLGLLGVSGFYFAYHDPRQIVGFAFGACLVSLFARLGGGIFTKAADVGADLVGKVEAGIPEDDPRNPAVIADAVGDNVGDCAGMGADLFETYAVTSIGAMILGFFVFNGDMRYVEYPLVLGALAIIATIFGIFFVRLGSDEKIMKALYRGVVAAGVLAGIAFYFVTKSVIGENVVVIDEKVIGAMQLYYASLVGLVLTVAIVAITEYYTSEKYRSVLLIANSSQTGPGTNIIAGLSVGMESAVLPALIISAGILISYHFAGAYGVAIAVMAMLSLTGMIVALDSYGPITDNAGGIAEMANLPANVRKVTDALDAVGNTTKAVTKGFAIGSAALAALTFFVAYVQEISQFIGGKTLAFDIGNSSVLVGLIIGGTIPFIFSSLAIKAVGVAAFEVVNEVRRQFKIPGIMEGKVKPEYGTCVDIVTRAALKKMSLPAIIAVASPIAVGVLLGPLALGGLLIGSIVTGLLLALQMANGGAAWDNAKKYIEAGNLGGKKTPTHAAAVVGDTVGDPLKDTAGPAINPLIKVMNTLALLFASLFV